MTPVSFRMRPNPSRASSIFLTLGFTHDNHLRSPEAPSFRWALNGSPSRPFTTWCLHSATRADVPCLAGCGPNVCAEAHTPCVRYRGLGRRLGVTEVMRAGPHDGISALIREETRASSLPCEDTVISGRLRARTRALARTLTMLAPVLGLQDCEE